ncbi:Wzz/FepE/Etk N-terminal domain-containing protein [Hoeflea sp. G2-23]|uniref:Wzz/FepE/Etk N-terminal domain-containing protein n=1 Tax=Hoeflea algicola TaxID=2983763 RepID=A0ABT3ZDV0_9HYPH|nr:GNVR domain-containing protein [Hoeflea algicola]MCY0149957.1 Wzz/FepE/Etk N-terminal domain-containing protein [Hoeflea algicola]
MSRPARNPRLSTSGFAAAQDRGSKTTPPATAPVSASDSAPDPTPAADPQRLGRAGLVDSDSFGDRIARLMGKVAPDKRRADPRRAEDGTPPLRQDEPRQQEQHAQMPRASAPLLQAPEQDHDDHYHWHAAANANWQESGSRPLLDASILVSAVWRFRYLIGVATVAGAVLGVLMALATPHKYYAESRLFIDPREIQVTADDIRNQQLSTEAMLAITDSQLQILSSTNVLEKVVVDLGLDRDPEFNGALSSGGIAGGINLIKELFTGKDPASEAEQKALNTLRRALSVSRDSKTFVIIVGVDTRDPEKSALIANAIVETYLDEEGQAQSGLLERTSESIDSRIDSLRSDLDAAERKVEAFKAENGIVGIGGEYIDDKVILALSDQLANARAAKIGIRVKADNLAKVKIDDVLSGSFPEEFLSSNLTDLRKQFTQTKSTADSLATQLGPRHPQYVAAKSTLDTIGAEIRAELRRIVASSQMELQRAVETEQELASQMAVAKSRAMDQSVEFVTLRELERKATATRQIYEAFLKRSRETSERSNMSTRNVRVISPAEAPLNPMGPSRKLIAIGGMFAGMFAGIGLALLAGAVESIRSYNAGTPQARFQPPPFAGYPAQPDPTAPGPRTPPRGPRRRPRTEGDAEAFADAADEVTAGTFSGARARSYADAVLARHNTDDADEPADQPVAPPAPANRSATPGQRQSGERAAFATGDNPVQAPAQTPPPPSPAAPSVQQPNWQPEATPVHTQQAAPLQSQPQHPAQPDQRAGYAAMPINPAANPAQPQWSAQPAVMPMHPAAASWQPQQPTYSGAQAGQPNTPPPGYYAAPIASAAAMMPPQQPYAYAQATQHPQPTPVQQPAQQMMHPHYVQAATYPAPPVAVSQPPYAQPHPAYTPIAQQPAPAWSQQQAHPQMPQQDPYAAMMQQSVPAWPQQPPAQSAPVWPQAAPPAQPHMQQPSFAPQPDGQAMRSSFPSQPRSQPPAHDGTVDRIRREMDTLRSRIDGYGAARRRG